MEKNALDVLMANARNRGSRKRPLSTFSCPVGCGARVTALDVNDHLDRCLGGRSSSDDDAHDVAVVDDRARLGHDDRAVVVDAESSNHHDREEGGVVGNEGGVNVVKRARHTSPRSPAVDDAPPATTSTDAFSHMMERSVIAFSTNKSPGNIGDGSIIRHRFHLHDAEGNVTWTTFDGTRTTPDFTKTVRDEEDGNATVNEKIPDNDSIGSTFDSAISIGDIHWSAVVTMKKVKCSRTVGDDIISDDANDDNRALELTMSSSLPSSSQGEEARRLVRRHSRLSVSHLKSCLQKSIRRRAPLPAIRVAMELADRSWGDLVRRLPIIVLEDSTLHPDFGLLVWLMVAESKGYFPCMSLLKRVMQVVFELASCARQDDPSGDEGMDKSDNHKLPAYLSLKTPTSQLFPHRHPSVNPCDMLIRSMLLRAQYGGMKCDVQMLHTYAMTWLKRFRSIVVPAAALAALASESTSRPVYWWDLPRILHEKAREKSAELVTSAIVCRGGLPKLNPADVCSAGIDFHCSSVVEHLLSQSEVFSPLRERLAPPKDVDPHVWISGKLKSMIWNYSSGINHRRLLFEAGGKNMDALNLKAVWENVVRSYFDSYTKKFVMNKLA